MKRAILLAAGVAMALPGVGEAAAVPAGPGGYPYCQFVDRPEPELALSLGYVTREPIEGTHSDFGFVEERGHAEFGYFRTAAGDLSLGATLDAWIATGGQSVRLPAQFGRLSLDLRWDVRTREGLTFRMEAFPGFYNDFREFSGDAFFVPFALSGIQAINDQFSARVGVGIYPGFEAAFDPILGLRWAPFDSLRIDAGYPESRVAWTVVPDVTILAGFEIRRTLEFQTCDDVRGDFLYREWRAYLGTDLALSDMAKCMVRAGTIRGRSVDFSAGDFQKRDVDNAFFFSIGIGGQF